MIKLKLEVEQYNQDSLAIEIEMVSQLIHQGYTAGEGWEVTGVEEKEPKTIITKEEKEDSKLID